MTRREAVDRLLDAKVALVRHDVEVRERVREQCLTTRIGLWTAFRDAEAAYLQSQIAH